MPLAPAAPQTLIATLDTPGIANPHVTALAGGGYVVVWDTFGDDEPFGLGVFGQRFDADGIRVGPVFQVNTTVELDQGGAHAAALPDGGFVVTFASFFNREFTTTEPTLHAQRFDAAGQRVGGEVLVAPSATNDGFGLPVAGLADGGYVVAYARPDGSSLGIAVQVYGADGAARGAATLANTTTAGQQVSPDLAALAGGGFVAIWSSFGQDGAGSGVYGQRFGGSGVRVGGEFRINTATASNQGDATVTALPGGGFVVSWVSDGGQDGSFMGVFAQMFSAAGAKIGAEVRVNATTAGNQFDPSVVALGDGGYAVAWTADNQDGSGPGIFARQFSATGAPASGEVLVNNLTAGVQVQPFATALPDGRLVVVWKDGPTSGLFQRILDTGAAAPPPQPPTQTLTGTGGADVLIGGAGDDVLAGLGGNDSLDGRGGIDTASYADAPGGVTVNLGTTKAQNTGAAGRDTLRDVENVTGSAFADTLTGSAGANVLTGGPGGDRLTGGGGADAFAYRAVGDSTPGARDLIADFSRTQGDRIDLRGLDAIAGGADDAFVLAGAFTGVAGQLTVSPAGAGRFLVQADVDGDRVADFAIEVAAATALTAGDFLL